MSVILCGTGLRAGQMTLETLAALKRCRRVCGVNLPQEVFEGLRGLLPGVEDATPSPYSDAEVCRRVDRFASEDGDVGVVFLGHPLLYTAAPEILRRLRRAGRPARVMAAVSSFDAALAGGAELLNDDALDLYGAAASLRSAPDLVSGRARLDARDSLVLVNLFKLGPVAWKKLAAKLKKSYGPEHGVVLVSSGADARQDLARALSIDTLDREPQLACDATLLVPRRTA